MTKPRKLLVICEPKYVEERQATRNLSTNEILMEYSRYFDEVHCLCPGKDNSYDLPSSINIKFHTINGYRGNKVNKTLFLLKSNKKFVLELIKTYEIDIIQFRIPSFMSMSIYNDLKRLKIPKTIYIAGDIYNNLVNAFSSVPFIKQIAKYFERKQFDLIKNTIAVATGDILKEKYKSINPNIHAYYSSTHKDVIQKNIGPVKNRIKICYIGRIDGAKRVQDLVEAISMLKGKIKDIEVNLIGDGNGDSLFKIKKMVADYGLNELFIFHGYIANRSQIDGILLRSNVLVLPSVTEGTAKVLPEAMSRGVVPIAVDGAGSNSYIIENGINGYLVKPMSPYDIADKLIELASSPEILLQMQKNCYKYAEARTMGNEIAKLWKFVFHNIA